MKRLKCNKCKKVRAVRKNKSISTNHQHLCLSCCKKESAEWYSDKVNKKYKCEYMRLYKLGFRLGRKQNKWLTSVKANYSRMNPMERLKALFSK
jgi:RecG-like helicase